ncbi:hypothetical protein [Bacillus sp. SM2101]|uniref:hypothetical protein n=1 Tax=Bacillus sp. SM2101 TaxID=2805366 RepID=UPI001BDDF7D3|nr:hypothetical protein [Bacillus sp. SM2101]
MKESFREIEQRLAQYEADLKAVKEEYLSAKNQLDNNEIVSVIPYFQYSVLLPKDQENTLKVFGSFVIKNIGTVEVNEPIICLLASPSNDILISGKIGEHINYDPHDNPYQLEAWDYVNDTLKSKVEDNGEYWLKPVITKKIRPEEQLSFANFHISYHLNQKVPIFKVKAFFYSQELKKGVASTNQIIIQH